MGIWSLESADVESIAGRPVVLSMSGGKDSSAVALLLERHRIPFRAVMMDTGWEHPATVEYATQVLKPRFGLEIIRSPGMVARAEHRQMFPRRMTRWCTQELKVEPFTKWLDECWPRDEHGRRECVNAVGIRRRESAARSTAERLAFSADFGCDVWRPLVNHTFDDVIAMHQEAGLAPNPLYFRGFSRVGCFPCINARPSELKQVAELWPERIEQIAKMEAKFSHSAKHGEKAWMKERWAKVRTAFEAAGEPTDWSSWRFHLYAVTSGRGGRLPAPLASMAAKYFAAVEAGEFADALRRNMERATTITFFTYSKNRPLPIKDAVSAARGDGQMSLALPSDDGCFRWGMCDIDPGTMPSPGAT